MYLLGEGGFRKAHAMERLGQKASIRRAMKTISKPEMEALRWAMESMLQYSTCQSFGLQGFDYNDQRTSCLAELCDRIGEDRDFEDMFPEFQD
ncbi:hypothetical protein DY000_02012893 [Brassica cretica]|uniref:Uncharacterized protein n=1 Tax=Brassica cretica TaxID=69181 RepID=A0ABQ7D5E6_BRACR|nr:hypothetical protein DY000_02012893 [Brassica cretica]